jgi:hypothetical protein
MPLVANTIDKRLERTVRLRERWLEFLLGAAPRIDEYGLADDPPPPLPSAFAEALRDRSRTACVPTLRNLDIDLT